MSNAGTPTDAVPAVTDDSSWQDHPAALAVAAIGGAIVIAGILYLAGALSDTGDEPPIRVKNGSLELYLLTSSKQWKPRGGDLQHWKISSGTRAEDPLDVDITVNTGATCSSQSGSGAKLTVYYDNGTKVLVESHGRKTWVDSDKDLTISSNKRMLSYDTAGYISRIDLDSATLCTFSKREQLANLLISDF